jgi:small subunit ribosomal protein S20
VPHGPPVPTDAYVSSSWSLPFPARNYLEITAGCEYVVVRKRPFFSSSRRDGPTAGRDSKPFRLLLSSPDRNLSLEPRERMANIKSQIKRNRQNEARRVRNKSVRSSLKTRVKRFEDAVASGDADAAAEEYRTTTQALDQAVSKGVIHKNKAANKKSRMARRLQNT